MKPVVTVPYITNRPLRGGAVPSIFPPRVQAGRYSQFGALGCPPHALGSLGLSQDASAAVKGASTGASIASTIGAGAAAGSVVPVIGTAIGAVIGAGILAAQFLKPKLGAASKGWNDIVQRGLLNSLSGRDFDERTWSEGFKGMMDEGMNVFGTFCGPDRHQNPDCFAVPLSKVIQQGYLSGKVPLSASTMDVYNYVILPWLQSGAGGQIRWNVLQGEPTQQKMILAMADRYLAGYPIARGDMTSYLKDPGRAGYSHTIPLGTALAPLLAKLQAPQSAPLVSPTGVVSQQIPIAAKPVTVTGMSPIGTAIVPVDQTAALMQQMLAQGASQQQAMQAAMASLQAQGVNTATPQVQQQLATDMSAASNPTMAGFGSGLPTWLMMGVAAVGLGFVFFRQGPRGKKLFH
jgi:hypothetical protein